MKKLIENPLMIFSSCMKVKVGTAILAVLITTKCGTKGKQGVETGYQCGECGKGNVNIRIAHR
eukprot:13233756-Heterocapsa_arctica.AAC.1